MIAQAMLTQCDVNGNKYLLLECFVDVKKDSTAISLDEQKAIHNGKKYSHCTTLGWHICCQWNDGSMSWEKLYVMKELHPLQIAKYAVPMGIDHKLSFNGWVLHTLKKHDTILP